VSVAAVQPPSESAATSKLSLPTRPPPSQPTARARQAAAIAWVDARQRTSLTGPKVPQAPGGGTRARSFETTERKRPIEVDRPFEGVGDTGVEPVTSTV